MQPKRIYIIYPTGDYNARRAFTSIKLLAEAYGFKKNSYLYRLAFPAVYKGYLIDRVPVNQQQEQQ